MSCQLSYSFGLGQPRLTILRDLRGAALWVDVTQRLQIEKLFLVLAQMPIAHVARADQSELHRPAANGSACQRRRAQRHQRRRARGDFQEVAPADCFLFFSKIHDQFFLASENHAKAERQALLTRQRRWYFVASR